MKKLGVDCIVCGVDEEATIQIVRPFRRVPTRHPCLVTSNRPADPVRTGNA